MRDPDRSLIERRLFKDAHGAIPDNRLRVTQGVRKVRHSFDADIHSGVSGVGELNRNGFSQNLLVFDWFVAVHDLMVSRQQEFNARGRAPLLDFQCHCELIVLDQ